MPQTPTETRPVPTVQENLSSSTTTEDETGSEKVGKEAPKQSSKLGQAGRKSCSPKGSAGITRKRLKQEISATPVSETEKRRKSGKTAAEEVVMEKLVEVSPSYAAGTAPMPTVLPAPPFRAPATKKAAVAI